MLSMTTRMMTALMTTNDISFVVVVSFIILMFVWAGTRR